MKSYKERLRTINEPYELLACAIVYQACQDYKTCIRTGRDMFRAKEYGDIISKYELIQFFKSEWFQLLCNLDGEYLLEKMEREYDI